jgi:hypothetical protein
MTIPQQVKSILRSRKFWALIASLTAIGAAFSYHQVDAWQAVQGAIASLALYSTGVALEDAGQKSAGK